MIEAVKKGDVMINPSRRIIAVSEAMSACVITGTEKVRSGYGNGDCILADFFHGLFAVADATERFSSSSRHFLERLLQRMIDQPAPVCAHEWRECLNDIYSSQDYRQKTTVSCVAMGRRDPESMDFFVMSGGDSAVVIVDENGKLLYQSKTDMNFAGRSQSAGIVDEITNVRPGSKVILYTDGYLDVRKNSPIAIENGLTTDDIIQKPVDSLAGLLHDCIQKSHQSFEHDDIALMAMDPFAIASNDDDIAILLGGTTPAGENLYQKREILVNDRYSTAREWAVTGDILSSAGFMFREMS